LHRLAIIKRSLANVRTERDLDLASVVKDTDNWSGSDVVRGCELAKRMLFRRLVEGREKRELSDGNKAICKNDLKVAFTDATPGAAKWRTQYDSWRSCFSTK
jgi:hypothetical protein